MIAKETPTNSALKYFDLSDEERTRFKEILEELKTIFNADSIDVAAIKEPPVGIRPKCDYEIRIHNGDSINYIFSEE